MYSELNDHAGMAVLANAGDLSFKLTHCLRASAMAENHLLWVAET